MEFRSEPHKADITVIHCEGRLNMVSAPELREVVKGAILDGRPRIVLDMSGVTFVDSSGLGSLVGCLKNAREAEGDLRLVGPGKQVMMVLQLSNLDRVFGTYDSIQGAYGD
jgi:anti-sigma B factor antagonist